LKIYQNFPYFAPYWAPKGTSPHLQACFLPSLVEIGLVVFEKKSFKGKSWRRMDRRRTDERRTCAMAWGFYGLRPGELIMFKMYRGFLYKAIQKLF